MQENGKQQLPRKTGTGQALYWEEQCGKLDSRQETELNKHSTGKNKNVDNWIHGKTETTLYWQEQGGEQQLAARTGARLTLYRQEQELGNHFSGKEQKPDKQGFLGRTRHLKNIYLNTMWINGSGELRTGHSCLFNHSNYKMLLNNTDN